MECKICKFKDDKKRGWVFTNTKDIPISYGKYKETGGSVYCEDCFENIKKSKDRRVNQNILVRTYFDNYKFDKDFRLYAYKRIATTLKVLNRIYDGLLDDKTTLEEFKKLYVDMLPAVLNIHDYIINIANNTMDFMTKDLDINEDEISTGENPSLLEYIKSEYNQGLDLELFYNELKELFGGRLLYIYTFGVAECYIKTNYGAKGVLSPLAYISNNNNVFMLDCEVYAEPLIDFITITKQYNSNVIFRCKI